MQQRNQLIRNSKRVSKNLLIKIKKIGKHNRKFLEKHLKIALVHDVQIPRFLNPILCYYFGDRLFSFQNNLLEFQVIFNNSLTKKNQVAKIYRKLKYCEVFWMDVESKAGIGHPKHLIERLQNSNNSDYFELSQLIQQQRTQLYSKDLDPEVLFQQIQSNCLKGRGNLIYCNELYQLSNILGEVSKQHKYWICNHFSITKDDTTYGKAHRKQFSHIMSEDLLHVLGYSLDSFAKEFITEGFPKIYNNICNIEDIKNMYRRDLFCCQNISQQNMYQEAVKYIPVNFLINNHLQTLNLVPYITIMYIINKNVHWAVRTYFIDEKDILQESYQFQLTKRDARGLPKIPAQIDTQKETFLSDMKKHYPGKDLIPTDKQNLRKQKKEKTPVVKKKVKRNVQPPKNLSKLIFNQQETEKRNSLPFSPSFQHWKRFTPLQPNPLTQQCQFRFKNNNPFIITSQNQPLLSNQNQNPGELFPNPNTNNQFSNQGLFTHQQQIYQFKKQSGLMQNQLFQQKNIQIDPKHKNLIVFNQSVQGSVNQMAERKKYATIANIFSVDNETNLITITTRKSENILDTSESQKNSNGTSKQPSEKIISTSQGSNQEKSSETKISNSNSQFKDNQLTLKSTTTSKKSDSGKGVSKANSGESKDSNSNSNHYNNGNDQQLGDSFSPLLLGSNYQ